MAGLFRATLLGAALVFVRGYDASDIVEPDGAVEVEAEVAANFTSLMQKEALLGRSSGAPPTPEDLIVVPLGKQYVPVTRNNRTVAWKTAYFGTVAAGFPTPQKFTVVFDTGSGHFILPSVVCQTEACKKHRRYDTSLSGSAVDVEYDGSRVKPGALLRDRVTIAFGTGEVTGEFIEEYVCLRASKSVPSNNRNRPDCVKLRVVLAAYMTPDPFKSFQFDGVLGLGLEALVLRPPFSFFGQMTAAHPAMQPVFAVYMAKREHGQSEIAFGGVDSRRLAAGASMEWAQVDSPELGYWQVKVSNIRIGNETLSMCEDGGCRAIADTGTSLLGVPKQVTTDLHWKLAREVVRFEPDMDCRDFEGPPITFDLGEVSIRLDASDYSRPAPARMRRQGSANETAIFCRASLLPVDMPEALGSKVFILGEPVLRKYYTAYDWGSKRIGFGTPAPEAVQAQTA